LPLLAWLLIGNCFFDAARFRENCLCVGFICKFAPVLPDGPACDRQPLRPAACRRARANAAPRPAIRDDTSAREPAKGAGGRRGHVYTMG